LGSQNLRKLDISNGCQDHTASPSAHRLRQRLRRACASRSFNEDGNNIARPARLDRSRGSSRPAIPGLRHAAASTASCPNVRDDGQRPSSGQDGETSSFDLPDGESELFLQRGLDRISLICPSGKSLRSVSINSSLSQRLDCFVACAPRNDDGFEAAIASASEAIQWRRTTAGECYLLRKPVRPALADRTLECRPRVHTR
jgi:hypothetical protein